MAGRSMSPTWLPFRWTDDTPVEPTFAPRTVAAGELFVLGDNRDHSLDSRAEEYGPVRLKDVLGKYHWTYWHARKSAKE